MKTNSLFIIICLAFLSLHAIGQQINYAEYFWDTDPGVGNGTSINIASPADTVNLMFDVTVPTSSGFHSLNLRVKDANEQWSVNFQELVFVSQVYNPSAFDIVAAEYFWDTDPGVGNGLAISVPSPNDTVDLAFNITTPSNGGFHSLNIRTKDSNGSWSVNFQELIFVNIISDVLPDIVAAEYFWDTDPGVGNATSLVINSPNDSIDQSFNIFIDPGLGLGEHTFHVRFLDSNGSWSHYTSKSLFIGGEIYVDQTATTGSNDGSTWADAYTDLKDALRMATPGSTIYIAEGTYYPDEGTDDRDSSFVFPANMEIIGGFASGGIAGPNPALYETVLSGDIGTSDVSTDNSYHVVKTIGVGDNLNVRNLTIINGYANGSGDDENAGAWYNDGRSSPSNPNVYNTIFRDNYALNWGGAFMNDARSGGEAKASYFNCVFESNSSTDHGGAGLNFTQGAGNVSTYFENCIFKNNSTIGFGGGVFNNDQSGLSTFTHINCIFYGNVGKEGGGISNFGAGISEVINCSFVLNESTTSGAHIHNEDFGGTPTVDIINSVFDSASVNSNGHIIHRSSGTNIYLAYSSIQTVLPPGIVDNGNNLFSTDPKLVDPLNGDLHLSANSPCINAGDNSANPLTFDLDSLNRVYDGLIDMGAYEIQSDTCIGSLMIAANSCSDPYLSGQEMSLTFNSQNGSGPFDININGILYSGVLNGIPFDTMTEGVDFTGVAPYTHDFVVDSIFDTGGGCIVNSGPSINTENIEILDSIQTSWGGTHNGNPVCDGESIEFTGTVSLGSGNYHHTFFIDENKDGHIDPTEIKQEGVVAGGMESWTATGLLEGDIVGLLFQDINASCNRDTLLDTISVLPCIIANIVASNNFICPDSEVIFQAEPSGQQSYDFYVNNVLEQTGTADTFSISTLSDSATVFVRITTIGGGYVDDSDTLLMRVIGPPVLSISAQSDISCYGAADGQVTISATGDYSPFTFDIGQGVVGSGVFTNLSPGSYTVIVSDSRACLDSISFTLTEPAELFANLDGTTNASCFPGMDGSMMISAIGGTTPYSFDFGIGPQPTGIFDNLAAGNYNVTVTDQNSCTDIIQAIIDEQNTTASVGFSGNPNFTSNYVYPSSGSNVTNFIFEVELTDATMSLPQPGYPRMILDYEDNGNFTDPNDQTIFLFESDPTDTDLSDGKIYFGTLNGLEEGSDYSIWFSNIDGNNCPLLSGPYIGPDVLSDLNVSIFADDISFSDQTPDPSDFIDVFATITNNSSFPAENFSVILKNHFDNTTYSAQIIDSLPAQSSTQVTWNVQVSGEDSWVPFEVIIDNTEVLTESNELDNQAIRPVLVGNYTLPVTMIFSVSPHVSPYNSFGNTYRVLSGNVIYDGLPPGINIDVQGAFVDAMIVETGTPLTGFTDNSGHFTIGFYSPEIDGPYTITGTITDFSVSASINTGFNVQAYSPPPACTLPDLKLTGTISSNVTQIGDTLEGNFVVKNLGCVDIPVNSVLHVNAMGSNIPIGPFTIPSLDSGQVASFPFQVTYSSVQNYSITGFADFNHDIAEQHEYNNIYSFSINVADKPNLKIGSCYDFSMVPAIPVQGQPVTLETKVTNVGLIPVDSITVVAFELDGITRYDTIAAGFGAGQSIMVSAIFTAPAPTTGSYSITVDPFNDIEETDESDNLYMDAYCLDLEPMASCLPFGALQWWDDVFSINEPVALTIGVQNNGHVAADNVDVLFEVSGPGLSGWVNAGSEIIPIIGANCGSCPFSVSPSIPFLFPQAGNYDVRITIDGSNNHVECDEGNNIFLEQITIASQPDLRTESAFIAPSKLNPAPGEIISLNVTYENVGDDNPADMFDLRVEINSTELSTVNVPGLNQGAQNSVPIPMNWSSTTPGAYAIEAFVDYNDDVNEADETNNTASRIIIVGPAPNFLITKLDTDPLTGNVGSPVNIESTVKNAGGLAGDIIYTQYYEDNMGALVAISTDTLTIAGGDSTALSIPFVLPYDTTRILGILTDASPMEYNILDNEKDYFVVSGCPGDLTFSTQGQIDSFPLNYPGCSSLNGFINIFESVPGNITNLDSLIYLESIGGNLAIANNTALSDISGLINLDSVGGSMIFVLNPALGNLNGLDSLSVINGAVQISLMNGLTNISALENLDTTYVSNLSINNNPLLTTCDNSFVCNYLDGNGSVSISGNAIGCIDVQQVIDSCNNVGPPSNYTTVIWEGNIDDQWDTPGNWNIGFVPHDTSRVIIPAGTLHSPNVSTTNTWVRSLQIDSGAILSVPSVYFFIDGDSIPGDGLTLEGEIYSIGIVTVQNIDGHGIVMDSGRITNISGGMATGRFNFYNISQDAILGLPGFSIYNQHGYFTFDNIGGSNINAVDGYYNTATISGNGTFTGDILNGGVLVPGTSPGYFTIEGDFTNADTARVTMEIEGTAGPGIPNGHDRIDVLGNVFLEGEIELDLISGFVPVLNDTFVIMTWTGGLSGQFCVETLPMIAGDLVLDVQYRANELVVKVVQGPSAMPSCTNLVFPAHGATDIPVDPIISWTAEPEAIGYVISMGTCPGCNDISNQVDVGNVTTYSPPMLPFSTTLYTTIQPYSSTSTPCPCFEESFTTQSALVCNDISVYLDAMGNYQITTSDSALLVQGSVLSGGETISFVPNTFDCSNLGNPDTVLVIRENMGTPVDTCIAFVTVLDTMGPVLSCHDVVIEIDRFGFALISPKTILNVNSYQFNDNGDTFSSYTTSYIEKGDVDNDGDIDFVEANLGAPNKILLNDGTGLYVDSGQSLGSHLTDKIRLGDIDQDGDLDMLEINRNLNPRVWKNDGTGGFNHHSNTNSGGWAHDGDFGDIDGDGDLDIVIVHGNSGLIETYLNNGTGTFTFLPQSISNVDQRNLSIGDIDGDGDNDLVLGKWQGASSVFKNDGSGNFAIASTFGNNFWSHSLADIDGDGDLDAVSSSTNAPSDIYVNDGSGNMSFHSTLGNLYEYFLTTVDFDFDGDMDIITNDNPQNLLINDGSGNFATTLISTFNTSCTQAADVDRDGDLDLILARFSSSEGTKVLINESELSAFDCDSIIYSLDQTIFECADIGNTYLMHLVAEDSFGNIDSCSFNVSIIGEIPTWYADIDGDGFGVESMDSLACVQPIGYVKKIGDCNDGDSSIFPGALEICDGIDSDCNGFGEEDFDGDGTLDCEDVCSELSTSHLMWQRTIGGSDNDGAHTLIRTSDNGFIMGGSSISNISYHKSEDSRGSFDYWIVKTDSLGNVLWDKTYGGDQYDYFGGVIEVSTGGFLISGTSSSGINGDKTEASKGFNDYWIIRIDDVGNILWQKTIGGNSQENGGRSIETADGGFLITGSSQSGISGDKTEDSYGFTDAWILKLSSSGNIVWQKTIGGTDFDNPTQAFELQSGRIIITGSSNSSNSGNKTSLSNGSHDFWLIKLDSNGSILWDKSYGGEQSDNGGVASFSTDSQLVIGGVSSSGISGDKSEPLMGFNDIWLIGVDTSGNLIWENSIRSDGNESCQGIINTADKGFILSGSSNGAQSGDKSEGLIGANDNWILKVDSVGIVIWDNVVGGNSWDFGGDIVNGYDGSYVTLSGSQSSVYADKQDDNLGSNDLWLFAFNEVEVPYYSDADGDGFGEGAPLGVQCLTPSGFAANNLDCDDSDDNIHPNQIEMCDGIDNNCDGLIDEGVTIVQFEDLDGDGYGNPLTEKDTCLIPGWVLNGIDCDDTNVGFPVFERDTSVSVDVPVTIPADTSTLMISGLDGLISDLNVDELRITHSWIGDIDVDLISPSGTKVTLLDNPCGFAANIDIDLDDEAVSASFPCPPLDGLKYQADNLLSAFNGEDPNGVWHLAVTGGFSVGSIDSWNLDIELASCGCTTEVNSVGDSGPGTLRAAIDCANINPGPDTINFNILGAGPHSIMLTTNLPLITDDSLVIDATTQPGNFPMAGEIKLDLSSIAGTAIGFDVRSEYVEIYGLEFNNSSGLAIGVNVFLGAHNFIIGKPYKGNDFNGPNMNSGVFVKENVHDGLIQSNIFGNAAAVMQSGVYLTPGCNLNQIGGKNPGESNYFNNCSTAGVRIQNHTNNNLITNNEFEDCVVGILSEPDINISTNQGNRYESNSFLCCDEAIQHSAGASLDITPPTILYPRYNFVGGFAEPGSVVEVYLVDTTSCIPSNCQGSLPIGMDTARASGFWYIYGGLDTLIHDGDRVAAFQYQNLEGNSSFSTCTYIDSTCVPLVYQTGDIGSGSMRTALDCIANGDTLRFLSTVYQDTIILQDSLLIDKDVFVVVDTTSNIVILGHSQSRAIVIQNAINIELNGVTICGGNGTEGSVILNHGTLTLENVTLLNLPGTVNGVWNLGELIIRNNVILEEP